MKINLRNLGNFIIFTIEIYNNLSILPNPKCINIDILTTYSAFIQYHIILNNLLGCFTHIGV
jgi:hypothetical protein